MDIHPIKTEADYSAALAEVERLWGAEENTEDGDKLDILITLVDAYEKIHYPIAPPDPVEAIKFRMEQMGLTANDLDAVVGYGGKGAAILNRQLELSVEMIRRLHQDWRIPLESLIGIQHCS